MIYADFVYRPKQNPNLIEIIRFTLILIFIKIMLLVLKDAQLVVCTADRISQSVNTYSGYSIKCSIRIIEKMLEKGEHCREIIEEHLRENS